MTTAEVPPQVLVVLDRLRAEIAGLFDGEFSPEAVRTDVDVLSAEDELVEGRTFDSLDLVQVIALVEDLYEVDLASALAADEPVTLTAVACYLVKAGAR